MRPLVWSDRRAAIAAGGLFAWLLSIELGTSRTASRAAGTAAVDETVVDETVVDTSTSRIADAAFATAIIGGVASSFWLPAATIRARRSAFVFGTVLLASSGCLSSSARHHLGRFHRDSLTVHGDHELVETGPYARVRHPLYVATIGAFVGLGAVLGNWFSVGVALLPVAALVRRIGVEERMLDAALDGRYVEYRHRTDRLIPGVW